MTEQEKLIKQQQDYSDKITKHQSREKALANAPTSTREENEKQRPLTATEIIAEAEIIYKWLIKDIS